jgi:SAM-dependent methyltransferase
MNPSHFWRWALRTLALAVGLVVILTAIYFPYATDAPVPAEETARTVAFYRQAYAHPEQLSSGDPSQDYVRNSEMVASAWRVEDRVPEFVSQYGLADKKILEVGAGRGYLQDVVGDYTGLDISPSVGRFFRKPFVLGSATALPFVANQFDSVWSIWTLEHVPNPEQALTEMRRVVKDGGLIYLFPAWSCPTWLAGGYEVRPYSDFGFSGALIKASIPLRSASLYRAIYTTPIRVLRLASFYATHAPARLHYSRLTPNYEKYWQGDSDAVNSIDRFEAQLWFVSRGDECLNCRSLSASISERVQDPRLLIRVHKR